MSEVSGGAIPVCDGEAAFNVALNKLVLIECWFTVTLTWRIHPPIVGCWCVNPPIWACFGEREAWGCCGASVHRCTRCEGAVPVGRSRSGTTGGGVGVLHVGGAFVREPEVCCLLT